MKNNNDSNFPKTAPEPETRFSEGQKLAGCYGIKRRIAVSDEAEVWLAHDEVLGKDVSLHFVPQILLNDAAAMGELRQQVRRNRQLIHPNILRVYDLVEDPGWAAISMDAFEGESLALRLGRKNGAGFETTEVEPWVAQLCQTLDETHRIGVMHRDVSLENLILTSDGKLLVSNFGISRCIGDATARISGTPSPRLAVQSVQQLDGAPAAAADDVYAVGVLLFRSLTGRSPFTGDDLQQQIREAVPPTVSSLRAPGVPAVSEGWEKMIAACLDKRAESRPKSLLEAAKACVAASTDGAPKVVPAPGVEAKAVPVEATAIDASKRAASPVAPASPELTTHLSATVTKSPGKPAESATPFRKMAPVGVYASSSAERSRFPGLGFALAAGLIVIGGIGYYFNGAGSAPRNPESAAGLMPAEAPAGLELRSVSNKIETPLPAKPEPAVPVFEEGSKIGVKSAPEVPSEVAVPPVSPALVIAAVATPHPVKPDAPVVTPSVPAVPIPAVLSDEERAVSEKTAALEKARQSAQAAGKAREDMAKQQRQAEAAVAEAQKALEQKVKTFGPVKKAVEEVMTQRKKLEEEQKAADLAAEQARQLAAEKARVADVAKRRSLTLRAKTKRNLRRRKRPMPSCRPWKKWWPTNNRRWQSWPSLRLRWRRSSSANWRSSSRGSRKSSRRRPRRPRPAGSAKRPRPNAGNSLRN